MLKNVKNKKIFLLKVLALVLASLLFYFGFIFEWTPTVVDLNNPWSVKENELRNMFSFRGLKMVVGFFGTIFFPFLVMLYIRYSKYTKKEEIIETILKLDEITLDKVELDKLSLKELKNLYYDIIKEKATKH